MLFLFYASFKASRNLAKTHKSDYISIMVFLIIFLSFLSTVFANPHRIPIAYPLGTLSYPFSTSAYWPDTPFELEKSPYNIQFFTAEIWSFPSLSTWFAFVYVFPFYLCVNIVGVVLGYWMNKRLVDEPFKRELFDFFFHKGLISFLALFIISSIAFFTIPHDLWVYVNLFSVYFFWAPAIIATSIYGIYKWFRRRKE